MDTTQRVFLMLFSSFAIFAMVLWTYNIYLICLLRHPYFRDLDWKWQLQALMGMALIWFVFFGLAMVDIMSVELDYSVQIICAVVTASLLAYRAYVVFASVPAEHYTTIEAAIKFNPTAVPGFLLTSDGKDMLVHVNQEKCLSLVRRIIGGVRTSTCDIEVSGMTIPLKIQVVAACGNLADFEEISRNMISSFEKRIPELEKRVLPLNDLCRELRIFERRNRSPHVIILITSGNKAVEQLCRAA